MVGTALGLGSILGPLIGAGAGAGVGAVKGALDTAQESKMRKLSADQMKWSPWTGMASEAVKGATPGADILGGLGAGLAQAQAFKQASADNEFRNKLASLWEKQAAQIGNK